MLQSNKKRRRIPIAIRERLVCLAASMTLVFTAWSIGGYNDWALHLLFLCALLTFSFSIAPMPISWNGYDCRHGFSINIKRLLRLPFFWLGTIFLIYILIQYLNPSVELVRGSEGWWVQSISPPLGAGMPSSVKADYSEMNSFRALVIHAAAMLTVWGILVGIQRRKTVLVILWSFVLSGTLMGFIAILQEFSSNKTWGTTQYILWSIESSNFYPWGTFMYRNQGVAFLILTLIVAGALYFIYLRKNSVIYSQRSPHLLCYLIVFILGGSIWLALSRAGIFLGGVALLTFFILALVNSFNKVLKGESKWVFLVFLVLGTGCGLLFSQFSNWESLNKRLISLQSNIENIQSSDRFLTSKVTLEMASKRLIFGWGAGSFRYIFPIHQKNYDQLWYYYKHPTIGWVGRKEYHYAHNDWFQFLAEYGIIGSFIIFLLLLDLILRIIKGYKATYSGTIFIIVGVSVIFIHNIFDFIFSSPAYWVAFWGSMVLVSKLLSLEAMIHKKEV